MHSTVFILILLVACSFAEDEQQENLLPDSVKLRAARNYDHYYDPGSYSADSDQADNSNYLKDDDSPVPPRGEDRYSFPSYDKGYDQPPSYDQKPPSGIPNYKGYKVPPYSPPSWKGLPYPSPDNGPDMVMMMDIMDKLKNPPKKEEKGFLSKLSDSKPALLASIIPLSIVLFSVAPIIMKYLKNSGPSMQDMVTTIASTKMGRALTDKEFLENKIENLVEFGAKILEEDECLQETLCKQVINRSGVRNAKTIANILSHVSQKDWLKNLGADEFVDSLQQGECKNICKRNATSMQR